MARGAVAALDEAGITHGVDGKVVVIGFDCNKWALRELLAGKWNYDGQCSPFQAKIISDLIKSGKAPSQKLIINEEKGFDAKTITENDINTYGLGALRLSFHPLFFAPSLMKPAFTFSPFLIPRNFL